MRTHLYIDGDNLLYVQREKGWWIDYGRFLKYFEKNYPELKDASYYSSLGPEFDSGPRKGFHKVLAMLGYRVTAKPRKEKRNAGGRYYVGCTDLVMCRDIILDLDKYDRAILVTGDGDFDCVIETLRSKQKEFLVVSTVPFIGEVLLRVTGRNYLDLDDIRSEVERMD